MGRSRYNNSLITTKGNYFQNFKPLQSEVFQLSDLSLHQTRKNTGFEINKYHQFLYHRAFEFSILIGQKGVINYLLLLAVRQIISLYYCVCSHRLHMDLWQLFQINRLKKSVIIDMVKPFSKSVIIQQFQKPPVSSFSKSSTKRKSSGWRVFDMSFFCSY